MARAITPSGADRAVAACEAFIRWHGYIGRHRSSRADAARMWAECGIPTLDAAPPNAGILLADWLETERFEQARDSAALARATERHVGVDGAIWLPLEANHG